MPRPDPIRLLPPVAAYVAVRLAYGAATRTSPWAFDAATFGRWDAGNYADIAQRGYYWATCAAQNRPQHGDICSTAAWYPAYPFLGRAVSAVTSLDIDTALVVVAHVAFVALLYVVWTGLLDAGRPLAGVTAGDDQSAGADQPAGTDQPVTDEEPVTDDPPAGAGAAGEPRPGRPIGPREVLALVLVAFFPGAVYGIAAFPLSLLVALLAVQVACFLRGRWWAGAAAGALASLCYPITAVLPAASAAWVWLATPAEDRRRRLARAAGVGAVVLAGTLAVMALHQVTLGDWAASLAEQRRFGSSLHNPAFNWGHTVVRRNSWIQLHNPVTAWPIAAQTVVVTLFVAAGAAVVARAHRQGETLVERRRQLGLFLWVAALWLLPLASTIDTGLYRRVLPLAPGVWLLRRAPWPVVAALTAASVAVWWWMAPLFDSGDLI